MSPHGTALRLFADYFQIHVLDADSESDLAEAWSAGLVGGRLALSTDAIAVRTNGNSYVNVFVEVLDEAPPVLDPWADYITEASIAAPSGQVIVMGCTDYLPDAASFVLAAGPVRVRVSGVDSNPPADGDEAVEQVQIQLWPGGHEEARVLKRGNERY
jgi:hypothetical protein